MRLMRTGPPGQEIPVLLDEGGRHHDLRGITDDIDGAFLAEGGPGRVRAAYAEGRLPVLDVTGQRIGPPVARPGVVLCVGLNYAAHAAESGTAPPAEPIVFYKAPNTVVGPHDDLLLPRGCAKTDWEVELAVVIGRRARYLDSPQQALDHIAGYVLSNDVSERALQLETSGGQWSKGKSCETFNPLGPWLVTSDEIPDPQALGIRSWVNGEPRQNSTTGDMIFDVATLVHRLSQVTVLEPGDILNTGTPEGVALSGRFPYLTEGDLLEVEIDGLGRQSQKVVRA
ncbi:fumarylacetoacetate hydrolase family protein [Streptomyces sp. NPDC101160]|uniref:fumarylacetoacetate hydrolase family protein n=1 Tax=Streptomyces sp. NPDC101160 TaxID=3366118 RepID=UPI0037FD38C4